ncbi:hypothetical protein HX057_06315 [Myroides odoratimimus]|uniref:hypothetical protein n=1 Tax=Myroides TaxID=76831 RepID=UPI0002460D40|nr:MULTISPECIES: hypothetical protein [Myroides]AJA69185.1 hypothetical protein MYRA21_2051 [Myroides sp. A21]EHO13380.1 hypothetical protein HMPREF9714_00937 [Myroides odoratimimus CCUG 12901]EKB03176.1 hypothetical protein HMPREF9711_02503 [Myroides odoratimimus CCUG 3837]MDM1064390.1 hypothetical protein [Myroides odoratimimus]MDM1084703.1 hypothetical protein [Myroides odoratimimus]
MKYTSDTFPELVTLTNPKLTLLVRIVFLLFTTFLLVLLYLLPFALINDYTDSTEFYILIGIYTLLFTYGIYKFIKEYKKKNTTAIQKIIVNKLGIQYHKLNGEIEHLSYKDLNKSKQLYTKDIFTKTTGVNISSKTLLKVFYNQQERTISFQNTDIFYTYLSTNSRELRQHFLQGVTLYRPDLKIADSVYNDFFINPNTFEFDKKGYKKTMIIALIISLVILAIVFLSINA